MNNGRREMSIAHRHQLGVREGDIIELTAISCSDDWHNIRSDLLFQKFKVISLPKKSNPFDGYNYSNWMQLTCIPIGYEKYIKSLSTKGKFSFERCQFKLYKGEQMDIFPNTMTQREKMLDKINARLNHFLEPTSYVNGIKIPSDKCDKKAWEKLFDAGHIVEAKHTDHTSKVWYTAIKTTFNLMSKREFRIAKEIDTTIPF